MPRRIVSLFNILLVLLIALPVQAADFSRGLLWQVESHGQVNYLFGTIHSEDKQVLQLPGPVQSALGKSRRFVMEVVPEPEAMTAITMAMMFTDGRELPQVIGDDLYQRARALISGYGIPENALRIMKPWAVATTLSLPKPETGLFLDNKLYQIAAQQGKDLLGLETAQEQLAIFDSLSLADQTTLLREAVDEFEQVHKDIRQLLQAYLARDLARLQAIYHQVSERGDQAFHDRLDESLVTQRNQRMLERMAPLYAQGGTFVAVGALHLPGKHGLLEGLQQRGYRLTRLY